ncbi:hypothetical protein [Microbulbifer hydrolyticus]|uniref:Uncharacterized protein n=1 Tax=Microbulbifer hydrolyticus TaxID=48074 RepID=A0A6P1T6W5_9GAMM|nr:hypothetical protein [Microbulbifer hydrolyticus]MBB5213242.1 hypothetical protein [Microbulbifer hydrolyticus]QHQ38498.1 hypothetical protein GTQ55_05480 [Microbulbifer hydrolyticus]
MPFSKAVGITVETTQDLIIYGYNLDSIPGKKIHEYSITNFPGPRNRYVLYRDRVPSGSKLNVVAVRRCSDCFLDSSPRVKIEIQSSYFGEVYQVPIYVDEKFLVKSWSSESKPVEINSEYFSRVD